jgi:hypothetical protein
MVKSISILLALTLVATSGLQADDPTVKADEDVVTVKVVGTLRTGLVAIGGETTGTAVKAKGITWELEFGQNAELKKVADKLNGKRVTVEGSLERRAGVEVKERWIITVTRLHAAGE